MRHHLRGCEECRAYYRRHLVLARLDPSAIKREERLARGLGFGARSSRFFGPTLVAALAAAAVLAVVLRPRAGSIDDFTARGGHEGASYVLVYRVPKDALGANRPTLAGEVLDAKEELAFAYANGDHKKHLLVYAVDEHRHVYWFFPAWSKETEEPIAIPIAADGERHELPEAVRHPFDGQTLEIHGLFVDRQLSVRDVETGLAQKGFSRLAGVPGFEDAVESTISFKVKP
jgi:hypothetical protein